MKSKRLISIEILRFIAAFSVLLHHIPTLKIGVFGVDIFFIISGFVMMLSTKHNSNNFLLKRIVRIGPLYWIATLIVFGIAIFLPELLNNTTNNYSHLFKSLLFIPFDKNGVGHEPLLAVGWTLNFEMYFYLLFYLSLIISKKYKDVIISFLIGLNILILSNFSFFIANTFSNLIFIEFLIGILIYNFIYEKKNLNNLIIITIISLVIILKDENIGRLLYYGLPCSALVFLFSKYFQNLNYSKNIINLGGMSYALYLSHVYVVRIFDRILNWYESPHNIYIYLATLISIIGSLFISFLIYKYLDIPIYKKLKSYLN